MEFVIVAMIGAVLFGLCFAVLIFRGRKGDQPAKLHMCGRDDTCQCRKQNLP